MITSVATSHTGVMLSARGPKFQPSQYFVGSSFELGQTTERHAFTEHEVLTSTFKAPNDYTISKRMLSRFIDGYSHEFTHWHFYIPTIYGETENPTRLIPYTINSLMDITAVRIDE